MEASAHGPPGGLAAHKPTFPDSTKQKSTSTNQRPGRAPPTRCKGASRAVGVWRHPQHPPSMIQPQDQHRAPRHELPEAQIVAQQARGDCKQLTRPWKAKPWFQVARQRTSDYVKRARSTTIHQTAQHPLCLERSSPTTLDGSAASLPHMRVHTCGQTTTHSHPLPTGDTSPYTLSGESRAFSVEHRNRQGPRFSGHRQMSGSNTGLTEGRAAGEGLQGHRPSSTPQTQDEPASSSEPRMLLLEPHPTPTAALTPSSPRDRCLSAQQSPHILQLPGTQGSIVTDAVTIPLLHPPLL